VQTFVKLMSKNSISGLWWRLVRACCVQSSMARWLLNCELLSTPAAGIYWTVCIPTCVKTLTTVVPGQRSSQPHAVSLSGCVSVWAERGEMQAHTDRQADLCMIFRLTCAWFAGWLMHDFQADLCMIFRPTYAWFSGRLMHDFSDWLYAWFFLLTNA
jgi:hypothetical protein